MPDKVSIIIPVYNIEPFIAKCIESVISQTYKNIEIIIVIDGATDGSLEICDKYARIDNRIRIIQKENGGVSSARNAGMEAVTGQFILFLDGDDWLEDRCIDRCLELRGDSDIVFFSFTREYGNKSKTAHLFQSDYIDFTGKKLTDLIRRMVGPIGEEMYTPYSIEDLNPVWNKLYMYDLIKDIKYIDMQIIGAEDLWFNLQALKRSKKVVYFDESLYHYNKINSGSLTRTYNDRLFERWKNLYRYINGYVKENMSEKTIYNNALSNRIVINLLTLVRNIVGSNISIKQKVYELQKLLNDKIYVAAYSKFEFEYMPMHWRAFYLACKKKKIYQVFIMIKVAETLRKYV